LAQIKMSIAFLIYPQGLLQYSKLFSKEGNREE